MTVKKASSFVDDAMQHQQINTDVTSINTEKIINVNTEKNMLSKKGLHLNRNGLKQFAKSLIDAIRELRKHRNITHMMKIRETIL